ncbi:hypothetical protein AURANDRAFT_66986 [Aureococcus anophagefferens]|uniref:MSP domain-containing protein n=1 Tax=Aureococcus anophagefferens TaxID=44056 RepID=F0YJI6_AURAN|nr:hypothetical protein AURANDRAFT_66986 [Aureococcus anophagefferens]EGB04658.1 hypothetical protein AURANDRAFT_66986 [Aureococcus anophagefferens]|eukprot:XP_009040573.1 hypothetical protein AURANDRAFT_66986 [Aureococcus anophagefferens]
MLNGALKFSPDECLDIVFSEGDNAETKLQITNIGLSPCIFKVKTTTPDRYLVKPNHGLIRQAAVTEISIVVVQSKKKDIMALAKAKGMMKCTDKFLVQSSVVDASVVGELEGKTSTELAEAITRLFGKREKRMLNAKKLLVDFMVPESRAGDGYHLATESTPEEMFAEIVTLRKKYDDLVAFTVKLTAERDSLSTNLAEVQKELNNLHDHVEYDPACDPDMQHHRNKRTFHTLHVLFMIFFSFFMGHYGLLQRLFAGS